MGKLFRTSQQVLACVAKAKDPVFCSACVLALYLSVGPSLLPATYPCPLPAQSALGAVASVAAFSDSLGFAPSLQQVEQNALSHAQQRWVF